MIEFTDTILYKLRFLVAGGLIAACLLLLPFLLHLAWINPTVEAANQPPGDKSASLEESPNAITRGMLKGADGLDRTAGSIERTVNSSVRSVTSTVATATVKSGKFAAHSVASAATATAEAAGNSVTFIAKNTGNAFGAIADTSIVGAIIRPADNAKTAVPVIGNDAQALPHDHSHADSPAPIIAGQTTLQTQIDSQAQWPMSGVVTTEFGVPHWPYQPVHTGIDISARQPGVTQIRPYKPGVVIETVRSNAGLGNHVTVDHGGGISSVYAHLSSISVKVGQEVDKGTLLGHEGSTGVSTGSHLHFEIRVNGQPVNPRQFIEGQP